jgi:hypothetical protein
LDHSRIEVEIAVLPWCSRTPKPVTWARRSPNNAELFVIKTYAAAVKIHPHLFQTALESEFIILALTQNNFIGEEHLAGRRHRENCLCFPIAPAQFSEAQHARKLPEFGGIPMSAQAWLQIILTSRSCSDLPGLSGRFS